MAAVNPFDQFDTPATAASAVLANPFDQFDATEDQPQFPDAIQAPAAPAAALDPFPEAVTPNDVLPDRPPIDEGPGAVSRGFVSGLLKQNPELLAETLEGLSLLGPEQFRESLASGAADLRALAGLSPEEFAPKARSLFDAGNLDEALTAVGETFGQGLASTVPSLVTGTLGGVAGARVAGRPGGIAGAVAGASLPAAGLNFGEVYKALKDEGVAAEDAAGFAAIAVGPMTALDVVSLGPIIIRLGGLQAVRKGLARNIARRVAVEAAKGAGREGVTEAIQETIKDATVSLASGKPFFTEETALGAAEAGISGALVGGALGGGAGIRSGRPAPTGVRERAAQEAAVRALSPSQDNLTDADRASPIPDSIISEGQTAVAEALESSGATDSANDILQRNNLPAVGARVTVTQPDGEAATGEVTDSFTESNAELGLEEDGIKIALDDGGVFEEFVGDIADRGIVIAPEQRADIPEGAVPAEVLIGATPEAETAIAEASDLESRAEALTARQAEQAATLAEIEAGVAQLETPAPIDVIPTEGTPAERAAPFVRPQAPVEPEGVPAPVQEPVRPPQPSLQAQEPVPGTPTPPSEAETAIAAAPSLSADLELSKQDQLKRKLEQNREPGGDQFGGALGAAQKFVRAKDGGRVTILALQKRFDLDHAQARRLHGKLRSDGDLTVKGFARAFRKTPRDVLAIIKEMGGVRPDANLDALDLRTSRPGIVVGKDKGGRSINEVRERLEDEGMLPDRSFDDAVYDLIGAALRKEPGRAIARGDEDLVEVQEARRVEDDNAVALEDASDEVRAFAKTTGEPYSAEKVKELATEALESGRDVEDAVSDDAERTAIVALESFSEEVQDDTYADIPFLPAETGQAEGNREAETRQPGPAVEPRVEGPRAAIDEGAREDRGPPADQEVAAPPDRDAGVGGAAAGEGQPVTSEIVDASGPQPLFRMSIEEVDAVLKEKTLSDNQKLLKAFGSEERVKRFKQLDQARNSVNIPARADEASAKFDQEFGDLTAGQERLVFGIGETDLQVDAIKEVRTARLNAEAFADDSPIEIAGEVAFAMRGSDPAKIRKLLERGTGPAETQAALVTIEGGSRELKSRGLANEQIDELILDAMERTGFSRPDAVEVLSKFSKPRRTQPTTERTPQGPQTVLPGAERTTGREFVEAQADKRIKGTKAQKPADEGLFDVAGRGQDELFSFGPVNPRLAGDLKRIGANLQARLKQLGIADKVALRVVEDLAAVVSGRQVPVQGRFTPGLIEVAFRAQDSESDTQWVLDHEVIHALRELELIRGAEWTELSKAAKADTERMGRMRDQRRGQGLTEEQIVEEAVADMFADWAVGRTQTGGFVRRAFERIRDFLTAFGRALTQRGYTSVNDIFEAVESGEVGRRARGSTASEGPVPDSVTNSQERFSLQPGEARTTKGRKTAFGRLLSEGRPIDRALRLPFDIFGGLTQAGEWKPGLGLYDKAQRVIKEAKFNPAGKFAWMNGTLEAARAGLIDRYGLSEEFVERERRRSRDERAIMLQGAEILKTLKEQNVGIEEAQILQAVLTGEAVPDERWEAISVQIRQAIDQLGQEAVSLGLLSPESYERNRGAYLHRVYMKHEAEQDALSRWAGRMMGRNRKKIIGGQFKGRGMFLDVEADKVLRDLPGFAEGRRGRLVKGEKIIVFDVVDETGDLPGIADSRARPPTRRVFWPADQAVPDHLNDLRNRGTWEVRSALGKKVTLWRDFTKPEREQMGEILDARYTIGKTFMSMAHDLATGRFYKDISENSEWTRSDTPNSVWVDASEYNRRWADDSIEWVRVPDTAIAKTGGKKRWGALAGKYVRSEIWRDLNELDVLQRPNVWQKLLTQWKLNKTARSPVVHMNNVMSNFVLMDLADIGMRDFAAGLRAYIRQTADFQEAADNGAFGSDMISQEIKRDVLQPLLKELQTNLQGGVGAVEGRFGIVGKLADRLWSGAMIADKGLVDLYRIEDEVFRMATYIRRRELGDSPQAAASTAREQFLDYDIRAPWTNTLRRSALPFLSYIYRAAPVIARSLAAHPWKIAKYFAIAYIANQLAYMMEPGDEDEERRLFREQEQGYTWIGTPRMQRSPWRDEHGDPVFLDVRRWIPAGDIFDMGQGSSSFPIPAPLMFGGPLMLAGELMLNRSAFTGQDITNERTDTGVEKVQKNAGYLWRSWMPSAAWVPGSWYWDKIGRAATGARDRTGRTYSLPQAVASSVGVKLKPQDVEQNFARWAREFDRVERDLRFEARRLESDRERGIISQETFDKKWGRLLDKFENLATSKQEVLSPRR